MKRLDDKDSVSEYIKRGMVDMIVYEVFLLAVSVSLIALGVYCAYDN